MGKVLHVTDNCGILIAQMQPQKLGYFSANDDRLLDLVNPLQASC